MTTNEWLESLPEIENTKQIPVIFELSYQIKKLEDENNQLKEAIKESISNQKILLKELQYFINLLED